MIIKWRLDSEILLKRIKKYKGSDCVILVKGTIINDSEIKSASEYSYQNVYGMRQKGTRIIYKDGTKECHVGFTPKDIMNAIKEKS